MANLKDQLALEREMLQIGADNFSSRMVRNRANKMESLSRHGDLIVAAGVDKIVADLRRHRSNMRNGRAGRGYANLGPLLQLSPYKVAAVAMRVTLDQLSQVPKHHALAVLLADRLWLETMLARASEYELKRHNQQRAGFKHKKADAMRMKNSEIWTPQEKLSTGVFLIHLVELHTGLIQVQVERGPMRSVKWVKATQAALDWVRNAEEQQRLLCPFALPTIVPPRDWSDPMTGGYWTEGLPGNVLIKHNAELIGAQTSGDEAFMVAANLQQTVGWKVNRWMLEQVSHAWDKGLQIGSLMSRLPHQIPPYPKHLADDDPGVHDWKVVAHTLHKRNDRDNTRRMTTAKQLWVARRMAREEVLYFPVQLDFRGRYYYRPGYMQPQANDVGRSLLLFANGTPINTDAEADWLRIHGANTYGHGKLSWSARIAWVHERQLQIEAVGAEPWNHQEFWASAKDPWQFLAFCRAYQQFSAHGYGWACDLPVVLDCTCSGIQHYSALLRSEDMAALVNLTSSDAPQDIYRTVLDDVLGQVRADAAAGSTHAMRWLQLSPDRTLAKPVVMTIPYSATRLAVVDQCCAWARERAMDTIGREGWPFQRGAMASHHYMATILYRHTSNHIGPAKAAMSWFRKVGHAAGKLGLALQWHSPSGLLVSQEYWDYTGIRIRLYNMSSVPMELMTHHQPTELNPTRMGNGLSPNVIHSLDASHMAAVTIEAFAAGVRNLGGIHDCFATTPAEMATLRGCIRSTFAGMYARDWFTPIADELVAQLPPAVQAKLPPRPVLGGFDSKLVNNADYFVS